MTRLLINDQTFNDQTFNEQPGPKLVGLNFNSDPTEF